DKALTYAQRLVEKYPRLAGHRYRLAQIHALRDEWPQSLQASEAAIKLDPFSVELRAIKSVALIRLGDRYRAQAEFDAIGVIDPERQKQMRAWFARQMNQDK